MKKLLNFFLVLCALPLMAEDLHYYIAQDFMESRSSVSYGFGDSAFADVVHSYGFDVSPVNSAAPFSDLPIDNRADDWFGGATWWSPDWTTGFWEISPELYDDYLSSVNYHPSNPAFESSDPSAYSGGGSVGGDNGGGGFADFLDGASSVLSSLAAVVASVLGACAGIVLLFIGWRKFRSSCSMVR